MIHFAALLIVLVGGVLGGFALLLFGFLMISIFIPILMMARDHKRGISTPLDADYTLDWEREFEEEKEEERWRG